MNLPNKLTTARCLLVPLFVLLISVDSFVTYVLAYVVFTAATITDYYDGKIARERNLVTNFGKLLDPVADKVLILSAFVMLMTLPSLTIPGWTIIAIMAREFLVTGARSLAASEGKVIGANRIGKLKTIFQMVYVFTILFFATVEHLAHLFPPSVADTYRLILSQASLWGIVATAIFTVYSGIQFAKANWAHLGIGNI